MAPLTAAHDELRDFEFKVEGGMNYGDLLSQWPGTSAVVRRNLDDMDYEGLPESERCDATVYGLAIAQAHDKFSDFRESVRAYIRDDGSENRITSKFTIVGLAMSAVDITKDGALTPGDGCE